MGLTRHEIEELSLYLQQLPDIHEVRQHSAQETVKALSKDILVLQKRGYTLGQISDALRAGGMTIATPTLKSYVQRARKPATKKSKTIPVQQQTTVHDQGCKTEVGLQ
jgi:hypothetical protein